VHGAEAIVSTNLLAGIALLGLLGTLLLLRLALLEKSLWHEDLVLGGDRTVEETSVGHVAMLLEAKNCGTVVCWLSCILR